MRPADPSLGFFAAPPPPRATTASRSQPSPDGPNRRAPAFEPYLTADDRTAEAPKTAAAFREEADAAPLRGSETASARTVEDDEARTVTSNSPSQEAAEPAKGTEVVYLPVIPLAAPPPPLAPAAIEAQTGPAPSTIANLPPVAAVIADEATPLVVASAPRPVAILGSSRSSTPLSAPVGRAIQPEPSAPTGTWAPPAPSAGEVATAQASTKIEGETQTADAPRSHGPAPSPLSTASNPAAESVAPGEPFDGAKSAAFLDAKTFGASAGRALPKLVTPDSVTAAPPSGTPARETLTGADQTALRPRQPGNAEGLVQAEPGDGAPPGGPPAAEAPTRTDQTGSSPAKPAEATAPIVLPATAAIAVHSAMRAAAVEAHSAPSQMLRQPMAPPVPLGAVAIEIGVRALAGARRFDIRLDPPELGRVDVRLDLGDDGSVKAHLTVDKVETLALLQRDARTLERAFEQAGLKPADGGVDLSLRDQPSHGGHRHSENARNAPPAPRPPFAEATEEVAPARAVARARIGLDLLI